MIPSFPSFKDFMDKRDASRFLKENDLCMFFKKDGVIYGTTESGRITFARMKNPETKDDKAWRKEASMIAYNLEKPEGENKVVMDAEDLPDLEPMSQEAAEKALKRKGKELPSVKEDDDDEYYGEE